MQNSDDTEDKAAAEAQPTAIAQHIARVLRDRIVKGEYPPGERLVERRISAELQVSRTPVREALKLLHADGLISISRNKGAQVIQFSTDEARHLFDVIAMLESLAAEQLAQTITPNVLLEIEALHEQMMGYVKSGNHSDYFDINSDIHDFIIAQCGNPVLAETHARLIARARRGRFMAIMKPERWAVAVEEHEVLMKALRARDDVAAAQVWRQHLLRTGQTLIEVLESGDA